MLCIIVLLPEQNLNRARPSFVALIQYTSAQRAVFPQAECKIGAVR